jgi:IS605 OrfB family transposase
MVGIADLCGKTEHGLHRHLASGGKLDQATKKRVMVETGLPGRYYNGITTTLQGRHDAVFEQRKLQVPELEERIKRVEKKIVSLNEDAVKLAANPDAKAAAKRILKLLRAVHGKKRMLVNLRIRLERFKAELDALVPSLCFGTKKLFNKQFALAENGYANHAEWLADWRAARASQFILAGSQDEISGNKTCIATVANDGSISLRLLVPEKLRVNGQKYLTFSGLRFGYGHAEIVAAIAAANATRVDVAAFQRETKRRVGQMQADPSDHDDLDESAMAAAEKAFRLGRKKEAKEQRNGPTTALTWRFVRDETGWTTFVSLSRKHLVTDWGLAHGAIGVDLNVGFVSVMPVDATGNPLKALAQDIPFETAALSADHAKAVMGELVKAIVAMALKQHRPIVIENLDFAKKKAALRETVGRNLARRLSSFSYSLFKAMLHSRAARFGVRVLEVNPAYTSHMGRAKYARSLGISVHRAAAAMIARRGMGLSEGMFASAELPLGDGRHVALPRPVRIGRRHVWASWGKHFGRYKAARKALDAAAAKSRSNGTRKAGQAADPVPSRCNRSPAIHVGETRHVAPTAARGTADLR